MIDRAKILQIENGEPGGLPFSNGEYESRLAKLRAEMARLDVEYVLLTSMHNIAYYSGFLYCSFGRPYGCVISADKITTVSANIDWGQPNRRCFGENITYTDWHRNNFWRAIKSLLVDNCQLAIEGDHLTMAMQKLLQEFLSTKKVVDMAGDIMALRMIKSNEEIALIKQGARIADIGGEAIYASIKEGATELEIAMAGRNAMEKEIAKTFPDAEYRDTWVWFQSGINTDGAHNPVTNRKLQVGDILSLNCFPMISGYYTALERTLFLGEADEASIKIWQANVEAHELGISLIKVGAKCSEICNEINRFFKEKNLLEYRAFGYGHSFGILSHYYGREAGLELREDIETVLEPNMVVSMEPMLTIPEGKAGAGGYREHDILVVGEQASENITKFPYGASHNII